MRKFKKLRVYKEEKGHSFNSCFKKKVVKPAYHLLVVLSKKKQSLNKWKDILRGLQEGVVLTLEQKPRCCASRMAAYPRPS